MAITLDPRQHAQDRHAPSPETVIVTDKTSRIESPNTASERLAGSSHAEATEQLHRRLKADDAYQPDAAVALKARETQFQLVVEHTPSAIFIHTGDKCVYANLAAERLTGYTRDELRTMPLWQLAHPEFQDLARDRGLPQQLREDVPVRYEFKIYTKTRETRWIDITTTRTLFDGAWSGLATVFDITQHKEVTQALASGDAQLRQSQKMEAVGQLAGGIAHDFNNLLTVIIGHSESVLTRVHDQPEVAAEIQDIVKAGERASRLTQQLLAFSRKQLLVPRVLDLNQVVRRFTTMLSRIVDENILFDVVGASSLDRTYADEGQIEQLLMNLVVNARDAMPQGGRLTLATANVVLDGEFARRHAGAVPGRYVSVTVHDTGCGMTADVLARVFEPFFTTKKPGKGTGLGLATVYGLVKQSGGYIQIESTPGEGTTITTYLPAVTDLIEPAAESRQSVPTLKGTETILLIEDDEDVRNLSQRALERYGYTVLSAKDTDHAIAIEGHYREAIHALVSDIIMPGRSGPEFAKDILCRRPAVKVLFVSGYAHDETIDLGAGRQRASVLQKPFTSTTLAHQLRECLNDHDGQR